MFLKTNWVCLSKNTQIYTDKQSKDLNTFLRIKISAKKKALRVDWKYFCFVLIVTLVGNTRLSPADFLKLFDIWVYFCRAWSSSNSYCVEHLYLTDRFQFVDFIRFIIKQRATWGRERSALNMINEKRKLKINKWYNWVFKEQVKQNTW